MIQDIYPHIYHNEYIPTKPGEKDGVFVFYQGRVMLETLADEEGESDIERLAIPSASLFAEDDLQYLFRIDRTSYFLYMGHMTSGGIGDEGHLHLEGFDYYSTRLFRKLMPKDLCFAGMTAWHLFTWYRDHRFCGRCGAKTRPGSGERVLICPACGNQIYPVIAPAVIVAVVCRNRILLTRYRDRPYRGVALIAGFCEIGETVEETVAREVMEEAGLRVKNLRYYKSQPWGFADNLLMGYYCELEGDETVHLDDQELAVAEWVSREEIGQEQADLSLTADMIMHFKEYGEDVLLSEDLLLATGRRRALWDDSKRSGYSDGPQNSADGNGLADAAKSGARNNPARVGKRSGGEDLPARIRRLWRQHIPGLTTRRKGESAVLIPLIEKGGEYHILFEKRACDLSVQPGEICFPGGGMEAGEFPVDTAVRETVEELKIEEGQIEILAALDPIMGPSGASVWPFAALVHDYEGTWSSDEVDHVFALPFENLAGQEPEHYATRLDTVPGKDFPYELIPGGKNYGWRVKQNPVYFYRGWPETIWGLTAKILYEFLSACKNRE